MEVPLFSREAEPRPPVDSASELQPRLTSPFSAHPGMLGLVIAAAIFNLLSLPLMRLAEYDRLPNRGLMLLLAPLVAGVLLGEIGAMACWLVWGEGLFLKRLGIHWGIGLLLGFILAASTVFTWSFNAYRGDEQFRWILYGLLSPTCMLPAISLAAQLPFWPLRTHFGWRLERPGMGGDADARQPLSILDILAGTAVVAVSLGLVRALQSSYAAYVWMQIAAMALIIAGIGVVLFLPAMIFLMRMRETVFGVGAYFGYPLLVVVVFIIGGSAMTGDVPPAEGIFAMLSGGAAFSATIGAPLLVWRACGYRLVWPRDKRRATD